jgi:DNA (cytosine-5)-methyltransferase 1
MTHGSLFSGIGGFDLAAQWMGWDNIFHCEWNPFGQRVLHHYWPNAIQYHDITKTDFTIHRGNIDVLTGGFPCQPYSTAGKRLGKEDERHLWPEMLRAIREIQPRWVVGENVRGLTNWNGGLVFDEVQADLESQGYEVLPFLLPACAVNAPHRRDRIWFVAHTNERAKRPPGQGGEFKGSGRDYFVEQGSGGQQTEQHIGCGELLRGDDTNPNSAGLQKERTEQQATGASRGSLQRPTSNAQVPRGEGQRIQEQGEVQSYGRGGENMAAAWQDFPTQSPVCSGDDGLPTELDGVTFSKWRNESIKAYGNAIVPQVAFEIFKTIEQLETKSTRV